MVATGIAIKLQGISRTTFGSILAHVRHGTWYPAERVRAQLLCCCVGDQRVLNEPLAGMQWKATGQEHRSAANSVEKLRP